MIYTIEKYFLLFMVYSVFGYLLEVTCKLISDKKFINRGFLIGPYCPIYGTGAILLTFLLEPFKFNAALVFFFAILVCGILEYVTSYVMEKLFKARWWDYSKYKFNINGRVCLRTIVPFGIFGTLVVYFSNPFILGLIGKLNNLSLMICSLTIAVIYFIDNIISFNVILKFKHIATEIKVDSTEEITAKVKQVIYNQKHKLQKRLLDAFPNFMPSVELIKKKKAEIKARASEFKGSIESRIDKMENNITEQLEKISDSFIENKNNLKNNLKKEGGGSTDVRDDKKV